MSQLSCSTFVPVPALRRRVVVTFLLAAVVLCVGLLPRIALARTQTPNAAESIQPYVDRVIDQLTEFRRQWHEVHCLGAPPSASSVLLTYADVVVPEVFRRKKPLLSHRTGWLNKFKAATRLAVKSCPVASRI